MCGRFNIMTDAESLMTAFGVIRENSRISFFEPQFNIAPSRQNAAIGAESERFINRIPIVRIEDSSRTLKFAIWPLIPVWAQAVVPKYSTANARSETLASLASYRNAWNRKQRCLIPATGFYEWQSVSGSPRKQPWHIWHSERSLIAFAGLWESSRGVDGERVESCTIVTTGANRLMSEIHNTRRRMPVIIDPQLFDQWLEGDCSEAEALMCRYPDDKLNAVPVSTKVNNPTFNSRECVAPADIG